MAPGKGYLSETCVADILVRVGMWSSAETYTSGDAIKINLLDLVLKRWTVTSEIHLCSLGAWRMVMNNVGVCKRKANVSG
jgi:hypothetical protein